MFRKQWVERRRKLDKTPVAARTTTLQARPALLLHRVSKRCSCLRASTTPRPPARQTAANMASARAQSSTPVPTTEKADPGVDGAASTVTEAESKAMADVLTNIYNYRNDE